MYDHLGVAGSNQLVPACAKLFSQFAVVVNLAIENDSDASIFVRDRLFATGQINNAQPPHSHGKIVMHISSFIIWSSVANDR